MLTDLIYAMLNKLADRRRKRFALAEMRRRHYVAEWHGYLPENRRRAARWS